MLLLPAFASDVFLTSKLEPERIDKYVTLIRQGFTAQTGRDPFKGSIKEEIIIDLSGIVRNSDDETKKWIKALEEVFKINLFGGKLEMHIRGIDFELADQNSILNVIGNTENNIDWLLSSVMQGLNVHVNNLEFVATLGFEKKPNVVIESTLSDVVIDLSSKLKAPMMSDWTTKLESDDFVIGFKKLNLYEAIKEMSESKESVMMTFVDFNMPKVSLEIGSKIINFDEAKIENLLKRNLNLAKDLILNQLVVKQKDALSNIFKNAPIQKTFQREQFFPLQIKTGVYLNELNLLPNQMGSMGLNLFICLDQATTYQDCVKNALTSPFEQMNKGMIDFAMKEFPEDSDIMISISQRTINNFLYASVEKKLWDKVLEEEKLIWASKGTFLSTDKSGDIFDLYLDVIYKFDRQEQILTGMDQIRFPINYKVKLSVTKDGEKSEFILKVVEVNEDLDFLIYGNEALGLESTIKNVRRFKKKVIKKIQEKVSKYNGRTMFRFELPPSVGLILDRVDFYADISGNLHGFFDLSEPKP